MEGLKKVKVFSQAKKLTIKSQDDCDLLEADPEKEHFMNQYRKNIFHFATCGLRKHMANSITLAEFSLDQLELPTE